MLFVYCFRPCDVCSTLIYLDVCSDLVHGDACSILLLTMQSEIFGSFLLLIVLEDGRDSDCLTLLCYLESDIMQ